MILVLTGLVSQICVFHWENQINSVLIFFYVENILLSLVHLLLPKYFDLAICLLHVI